MNKPTKTKKLASDKEARKCAKEFITAAVQTIVSLEDIKQSDNFYFPRIVKGKSFKPDFNSDLLLSNLVSHCVKKLGTKIGNEHDIRTVAWEVIAETYGEDVDAVVKVLIDKIQEQSATEHLFIAPNCAVSLQDNVKQFEVGPVRIKLSESLKGEHEKPDDKMKWKINLGAPHMTSWGEKGIELTYPAHCWEVSISTSPSNVQEEAFWLINIALSCIRLYYPEDNNNFFPTLGKLETHPLLLPVVIDPRIYITRKDRNTSFGKWVSPLLYVIDKNILGHFDKIDFKNLIKPIFNYKEGTVAERVAHGFGWMTKGRHTVDKTERFLFFYTAIEALVTSGDKNNPVTQTIARNAASIIDDRPKVRLTIAQDIIKSYGIRSSLVHGGRRNVSDSEAYMAQLVAETICKGVIKKIDLHTENDDYEKILKEASYGLPLPSNN